MAYDKPRLLGSAYSDGGIQNRVYRNTPITRRGPQDHSSKTLREENSISRRSGCASSKECYNSNTPSISERRVLVDILLSSKENGRLATNSESETPQQIYKTKKIQNGDTENSSKLTNQGQMGNFYRLKRCLPAYPYSSFRPEVASLPHSRPRVRVPVSSIWPCYKSKGFYSSSKNSSGLHKTSRYPNTRLFRRLDYHKQVTGRGKSPSSYCDGYCDKIGIYHKYKKIQPRSVTTSSFSRSKTGPEFRSGNTVSRKGCQHDPMCRDFETVRVIPSNSLAKSVRTNGQLSGSGSVVPISHETHSVASFVPLQSVSQSLVQDDSHDGNREVRINVVGKPQQSDSGCGVSTTSFSAHFDDRCLPVRMGRPFAFSDGQWDMVTPRVQGAYQPSGALGSLQISSELRRRGQREIHSPQIRQLHGGVVYQSTRGDEVSNPMSAHERLTPLVYPSGSFYFCGSHSGSVQCLGGQFVQGRVPKSNRMVPVSSDSSNFVQGDLLAVDRPICVNQESQTSSILFQNAGSESSSSRCPLDLMVRDDSIRFPANFSSTKDPPEDSRGRLSGSSDCTILASPVLVQSTDGIDSGSATLSSRDTRSSTNAGVESSISRSRPLAPDCMAIVAKRFQEEGFSEQSADLAARGRRESTYKVYSARLRSFFNWCKQRKVTPSEASIGVVADFLKSKFDQGLQVTTVKGYRSAIQAIHRGFQDGSSVGNNRSLNFLIEGMFIKRPPVRKIMPSWDLPTVLEFLRGPPFEPAQAASLRDLTLKTVFLIAMASGRRSSELHALAIGKYVVFGKLGVTLYFCPGFLAKNERSNFTATPLFLPSLNPQSSQRRDRLNCPVRILRWYLDRTSTVRVVKGITIQQLFITTRKNFKPAAKATLAGWLVDVIKRAKAVSGEFPLTAHSTRAISSSWAFNHGISINEIINTVAWKSETSFVTCYLRNTSPSNFASSVLNADLNRH